MSWKFSFLLIALLSFDQLMAQPDISSMYEEGRYEEVIAQATKSLDQNDTFQALYYLKALSESHLGRTGRAIHTAEQGRVVHASDVRLGRLLARLYLEAGNYPKAEIHYSWLVKLDSLDQTSWLKLAEIAYFRQHYSHARNALERVLHMDSLNMDALVLMGDILQKQHAAEALPYLERVARHYPENQKAAYTLANWYVQEGRPEKAISVCHKILSSDSTNVRFNKLMGYSMYKSGDHFQAVPYFEKAVALGDESAFCFKFLGISRYLSVDMEGAADALRWASDRDSLDAEIHFFLGASLVHTADKTGAMGHMDRALELLEPDGSVVSRIYAEQANLKRLEESYLEAYALYSRAWEADSTNLMALYLRASIQDNSLHNHDHALEDYRFFLEQLDRQPSAVKGDNAIPTIRSIVEDRITTLKEERFFLDR